MSTLSSTVSKFRAIPKNTALSLPTQRTLWSVGSAMLVGIGYYIGTLIGFGLTPSEQPISAFWPPNAILLAAFLVTPARRWWTLLLAVLPVHMLAQLQAGVPVWTATGWFISNTSEALIGAFLITRLARPKEIFDNLRGIIVFVGCGVVVGPFATSFLDAGAVVLTRWGRGYWPLSAERFWTNALAELTVVPTIVLVISHGRSWIRKATPPRYWESGTLAVATVLVAVAVFGLRTASAATIPALLYAPLPLLLWATIRFGSAGLSQSLLCIALISSWYTIHGREPFPHATMAQNILSLQILFCLVAVPLLFLSAVIAEAESTQESVRRLSVSLIEAQEQERHRIARELHDDLGQELALAQVKLSELIDASNESTGSRLAELSAQLVGISTTARDLSHGLYPSHLEYVGLATSVKRLCNDVQRAKHLSINLTVGSLPERLDPPVALCLYRVAQEALHNIISHSQAKCVQVQLGANNRGILLRVIDDGIGFDFRGVESGLGLSSMKERVRSIGGSIDITSVPDAGTRIEVSVPIRENDSSPISHVA